MVAKDESPFNCESCTNKDRDVRNCNNGKGLTEAARAVDSYSDVIVAELKDKSANKVFRLGDIRLYECPLSYINVESVEVIRLVSLADGSSTLLLAGGWAAQPTWFVEAYELYKTEFYKEVKGSENEHGNR